MKRFLLAAGTTGMRYGFQGRHFRPNRALAGGGSSVTTISLWSGACRGEYF